MTSECATGFVEDKLFSLNMNTSRRAGKSTILDSFAKTSATQQAEYTVHLAEKPSEMRDGGKSKKEPHKVCTSE